jgi:hypothetical protein
MIGACYIGSGVLFKPSMRERGKSLVCYHTLLWRGSALIGMQAKKQFNKMGLLGFYKVMLTRSSQSICQVLRICAGKTPLLTAMIVLTTLIYPLLQQILATIL